MNFKFGKYIRTLRQYKNLTLEALAELCDMSSKGIDNIELGKADPHLSTVRKLAAALDIDCGELNDCDVPSIHD